MPKFDSKKAETPVFEVLSGDYPFEIVAVDKEISQGQKTRGSDTREVKLKFYKDTAFVQPVAQWTESFIYHESTEWKVFVFTKCVGFQPKDGEDVDIDQSWIGRRGWATCKPEPDRNDKDKKYNRVAVFITNKGVLPPKPRQVEEDPEDKMPF